MNKNLADQLSLNSKVLLWVIWTLYTACLFCIAPYHEQWADEVQAFLIARDASIYDIIAVLPHQEGHPSLWHLLLKLLIFIFGAELNITYISVIIMSLTVYLLLFKIKIPLSYKILLPFGHYFLYQYSIISRNYSLAYLALVLLCIVYEKRHQYIWRYALILLFLAESVTFYAPVSAILGLIWFYKGYKQTTGKPQKYFMPMFMLALMGLILIWQCFPVNPFTYTEVRMNNINNTPLRALVHFPEAFFAGKNILLNLIILCWLGWGIFKFVTNMDSYKNISKAMPNGLYMSVITLIFTIGYCVSIPMYYHQGLIWGLFLCEMYIFFPQYVVNKRHYLFFAFLLIHIYWSVVTIKYDIENPVSPQFEIMQTLKKHHLENEEIKTKGYYILPFKTLINKNQLLEDEGTLYSQWTKEEYENKYNYNSLLEKKYNILILNEFEVQSKKVNLGFYEDKTQYIKYIIPAAMCYKGFLFYEQSARVYIKNELVKSGN